MIKRIVQRAVKGVRRHIWQAVYPQHYWHMRHYDGRFRLTWQDGCAEIAWRRRPVARSIAIDEIAPETDIISIIASGPSLLTTPPDAWRGRDIACVNGSILWARERDLRPRIYVVSDPGFVRRRIDLIELATRQANTVCLTVRCLFEVLRQRPEMFAKRRPMVFDNINQPFGRSLYSREQMAANPKVRLDDHNTYEGRYIGISTDLATGIFAGGTVVLAAAQVAMALGYRDIQFLGLDMKQSGAQHRFYEERKPEPSFIDRNFEGLILPSFVVLRRHCDAHGVVLSNWSPDSAIPRALVPAVCDRNLTITAA
jgi:Kdo-III transferase WaaZ